MEGATEMNVNNAAGTDYALVCSIYILDQYYSFFFTRTKVIKKEVGTIFSKCPFPDSIVKIIAF